MSEEHQLQQSLKKEHEQCQHKQHEEHQEVEQQKLGQQELGQQELGQQELGRQDLGRQELGRQDLGRHDLGQQELGRQELGQQDLGQQELGHQELGRQELGRHDLGQQELAHQELDQQELGQQELGRQDLWQQELGRQEFGQRDLGQQNLGQQDLGQHELGQHELGQQELGQQELGQQEFELLNSILEHYSKSQEFSELFEKAVTELKIMMQPQTQSIRYPGFLQSSSLTSQSGLSPLKMSIHQSLNLQRFSSQPIQVPSQQYQHPGEFQQSLSKSSSKPHQPPENQEHSQSSTFQHSDGKRNLSQLFKTTLQKSLKCEQSLSQQQNTEQSLTLNQFSNSQISIMQQSQTSSNNPSKIQQTSSQALQILPEQHFKQASTSKGHQSEFQQSLHKAFLEHYLGFEDQFIVQKLPDSQTRSNIQQSSLQPFQTLSEDHLKQSPASKGRQNQSEIQQSLPTSSLKPHQLPEYQSQSSPYQCPITKRFPSQLFQASPQKRQISELEKNISSQSLSQQSSQQALINQKQISKLKSLSQQKQPNVQQSLSQSLSSVAHQLSPEKSVKQQYLLLQQNSKFSEHLSQISRIEPEQSSHNPLPQISKKLFKPQHANLKKSPTQLSKVSPQQFYKLKRSTPQK